MCSKSEGNAKASLRERVSVRGISFPSFLPVLDWMQTHVQIKCVCICSSLPIYFLGPKGEGDQGGEDIPQSMGRQVNLKSALNAESVDPSLQ